MNWNWNSHWDVATRELGVGGDGAVQTHARRVGGEPHRGVRLSRASDTLHSLVPQERGVGRRQGGAPRGADATRRRSGVLGQRDLARCGSGPDVLDTPLGTHRAGRPQR